MKIIIEQTKRENRHKYEDKVVHWGGIVGWGNMMFTLRKPDGTGVKTILMINLFISSLEILLDV